MRKIQGPRIFLFSGLQIEYNGQNLQFSQRIMNLIQEIRCADASQDFDRAKEFQIRIINKIHTLSYLPLLRSICLSVPRKQKILLIGGVYYKGLMNTGPNNIRVYRFDYSGRDRSQNTAQTGPKTAQLQMVQQIALQPQVGYSSQFYSSMSLNTAPLSANSDTHLYLFEHFHRLLKPGTRENHVPSLIQPSADNPRVVLIKPDRTQQPSTSQLGQGSTAPSQALQNRGGSEAQRGQQKQPEAPELVSQPVQVGNISEKQVLDPVAVTINN